MGKRKGKENQGRETGVLGLDGKAILSKGRLYVEKVCAFQLNALEFQILAGGHRWFQEVNSY